MPRTTKDGKVMTFHLKREAVEALEEHCRKTGASKTAAVELAIIAYTKTGVENKR